jgi:hypothetical protein
MAGFELLQEIRKFNEKAYDRTSDMAEREREQQADQAKAKANAAGRGFRDGGPDGEGVPRSLWLRLTG